MSYFPFIHMQVAWEGWSDAEQEPDGRSCHRAPRCWPPASPALLEFSLCFPQNCGPTEQGPSWQPLQTKACLEVQLRHREK